MLFWIERLKVHQILRYDEDFRYKKYANTIHTRKYGKERKKSFLSTIQAGTAAIYLLVF